jgi:hypothetical protein
MLGAVATASSVAARSAPLSRPAATAIVRTFTSGSKPPSDMKNASVRAEKAL